MSIFASKKFWAFVATFATFMALGDHEHAFMLAVGYLGVQGVVDTVNGIRKPKAPNPPAGVSLFTDSKGVPL